MDKLKMQSENLVDKNIEKIAKIFPNCVTEAKDENGKLVKMVDFDLLKQELSKEIVEGNDERYTLNWPGKKHAILTANSPINATLRPCKEESVGKDGTPGGFDSENLYIEGDNLDVLKLLRETYLNKVKMIYIDPPYNTGHDFVYEDDFASSAEEYLQASKSYDEQGNRMFQNSDSNGRFHSDWLSMMYSRLKIAKDLLSDDGVVFISIDDNEQANVLKLCNEIFGEQNKVAEFVVIRAEGGGMAKQVIKGHEYLFVFAKDISKFSPLGKPKDIRGKIIEKDGGKFWIQEDWLRKEFGKYGNCHYEEVLECKGQEKLNEINEGLNSGKYVLIPKLNGMNVIGKLRNIKEDSSKFYSILKHLSANGIKDLEELGLNNYFSYPKPVSLISEIVAGATIFTLNDGEIVLDFFSGSATTAHAVMKLNAEDGGNRKFIMVQLPELTEEKSEAYKAGYKNICEIGKERIRRAGKKIKEDRNIKIDINKDKLMKRTPLEDGTFDDKFALELDNPNEEYLDNLDIGFRVLKLDSSCMKDVYYNPLELDQTTLLDLVSNIKEDRTDEDLLFQVMLDMGIMLSSEIKTLDIKGKKVFNVNNGNLICCFEKDLTDEVITEIAKMKPLYAVFKDSGMKTDSVAVNFDQIFDTYSDTTIRKVL